MIILKLELIELTNKLEFGNTYDIYKYCMFMPTKEKFQKKTDQFATDDSIKIFACFHQGKVAGIIVVSFTGQHKIEIVGIAVDVPFRNKGIGSYMINCLIDDYSVKSIFAETDKDADFNCGENNSTTPVDAYSKTLSACGAVDMWGNVWEWTSSTIGSQNIIKGGAWDSRRTDCRTESRGVGRNPGKGYANVGF